ncbi:MAG: hypothetical protein E6J34_02090 [Chloroflexi bacterium]|nr:MAG: hypothetical protein E6J34_02090 [Chloroflexota bacterium]
MPPELELRLQASNKTELILLLQELATRHPDLLAEMQTILETSIQTSPIEYEDDLNNEVTEDWDFSGDDLTLLPSPSSQLLQRSSLPQSALPTVDLERYGQRIADYHKRLKQKKTLAVKQAIKDDLIALLQDAEHYTTQRDYANAIALYALVLDERLAERDTALTTILDQALNEAMPILETLLSDMSSYTTFDGEDSETELHPRLSTEQREGWLARFFTLWLKHLDKSYTDDILPEIILDIAWANDSIFLRNLVQHELERLRKNSSSNIVDFKQQYRTRMLDKFLKEI